MTGLPLSVWLRRGVGQGTATIEVTPGKDYHSDRRSVLIIEPVVMQAVGGMHSAELAQVETWAMSNSDVIQDYWEGAIATRSDVVNRVTPVAKSRWSMRTCGDRHLDRNLAWEKVFIVRSSCYSGRSGFGSFGQCEDDRVPERNSKFSIAPSVPRGASRFEVRVQRTGAAHHPYRWEIINDDSGQVIQVSDEEFRKPRQAWEAGSAAIRSLVQNGTLPPQDVTE